MIASETRVRHSPGPFRASKGDEDDPNRWLVLADKSKPFIIATIENGQPGDTLETEAATAHLFAAAPEMLAALKAWKAFRDGAGRAVEGEADRIEQLMEAAILKADTVIADDDEEPTDPDRTDLYKEGEGGS